MPRTPAPPAPLDIAQGWRPRVGAALKQRRQALRWSRERLAEVAGYSRGHVNKAERGAEVGLEALVLTCAALGVRPSDIFASAGL